MPIRVAINGFGRIGRAAFKIAFDKPDIEIVAVNDLTDAKVLAHLLKYDTVYGIYDKEVKVEEGGSTFHVEGNTPEKKHFEAASGGEAHLLVNGKKTLVLSQKDPALLPWKNLSIDVVLECTGRYTNNNDAAVHVKAGAKKVIISAPAKGGSVQTYLLGVNSDKYLGEEVVSNASCTTNCISPVAGIIHSKFGILKASMTTIHAITAEQMIVDGPPPPLHHDLRRARAAGFNLVPTTTGAAVSTTEVIPELKGLFDGLSVRAPVMTGSLSDFTMLVKREVTVEEVNEAFLEAKKNPLYKNVIDATYEPFVSSDVIGSPYSAIVDLSLTKVIDGDLLKVVAWYDNEWGYSNRLVEMVSEVVKS
ncbi:type I glyceraldehyde-3-phosphate dehydrogenase [candidate division WWE3 bacterium RIFCSPHIGHO2_01_FULL_40_23]|uniref:Glyceraldehyde-3-phosphate dehydrogenase n=1 Tax=candidate division WWE3 bacterium RIFCSPLOWO2_01_FULL_41_18 TaxID=1802625 RepID=A0A1F4VE47_UNCKA|nr:MAG: type I glyceraldehyde-3-phosphate dehydrogenase [candidate division WWE3 bacterium RIFCSPHIGHO2_01_FULL_40_23]OGC55248.1 MAG: type I glyceraldehyde-3-phosphate dehydrogenase [candidate division WWE3 bacterium RIFCSPLOWO2_01_FULL_41_18]